MKLILLLVIASGTLLFPVVSQAQYKYIKRSYDVPKEKETYRFASKKNNSSENRDQGTGANSAGRGTPVVTKSLSQSKPNVAEPPLVNDPIDVYAENPVLVKATLSVHFGTFSKLPGLVSFAFYCDPYYDYHTSSYYILVSSLQYSNIHPDTVYQVPVYEKSPNHWTAKYQDFVTKWLDAAHTHLTSAYWSDRQGGKIEIQPLGIDGTITKVILVLQFESGTKTIVWDTPRAFSSDAMFQFDQNFSPMK